MADMAPGGTPREQEPREAPRRLRRSVENRVIAGVCSGVAEYLGASPVLIRILWLFSAFWKGTGVVAYILAVLVMPAGPSPQRRRQNGRSAKATFGALLVIIGAFFILKKYLLPWGWWPSGQLWMPLVLISLGLILIISSRGERKRAELPPMEPAPVTTPEPVTPAAHKMRRSRKDRVIFGICGGLGDYYNVDPVLIRVVWIAGTLATQGLGLLAYILMYFLMPLETSTAVSDSSGEGG